MLVALLVLALIALVLGFVVAKWLLIVGVILLIASLLSGFAGRRSSV